ncbi:hypothetical protein Tco_1389256, partial [Tanacetum coccineum]
MYRRHLMPRSRRTFWRQDLPPTARYAPLSLGLYLRGHPFPSPLQQAFQQGPPPFRHSPNAPAEVPCDPQITGSDSEQYLT